MYIVQVQAVQEVEGGTYPYGIIHNSTGMYRYRYWCRWYRR